MTETPAFIDTPGGRLFTVFHAPAVRAHAPVVFCHPFAEEKLWSHRVHVAFARQLAEDGYPVLRFDFRGNGDSEGTFKDASLATALADVRAALRHVRQATGAPTAHLLGLRLGATIASIIAEEDDRIEQLILWAPVVDGSRYMQDFLRVNLSMQVALHKEVRQDRAELAEVMRSGGTVNVDGYDLAFPMFSEVSAVNLLAGPKRHRGPCLIVQIEPAGRSRPDLQQLAALYPDAVLASAREEAFWKEIPQFYGAATHLFATTREWQAAAAVTGRSQSR